jgi:hypothetical protein
VTTIVPAGIVDCDAVNIAIRMFQSNCCISRLHHSPIVPKRRRSGRPLEPYLYVHVLFVYIIQVVEDHITFGFVETNNAVSHGTINPKRLPASGGVDTHKWVNALN